MNWSNIINLESLEFKTEEANANYKHESAPLATKMGARKLGFQAMCGWRDDEVTRRYIREAGLDIRGVTDSFKIISPDEAMGTVVSLYAQHKP